MDLGQITTWDDGWWLVVDTDFETSWTPVDELDGSLGLDVGDRCVDILWYDITTVQETAGHVFTVSWVTFDHLVRWLETSVGDFRDGKLFVVCFFGRDDWCVGGEREVNTWVWDQVSLEFGKIDIEGTIESEGSGDG